MSSTTVPLDQFGPTAARKHLTEPLPRPKTLTVDMHSHMRITATDDFVKPHLPTEGTNTWYKVSNARSREIYDQMHACRVTEWTDATKRLEAMEEMQIDVSAISCLPPQMFYTLDAEICRESSRITNDGIASNVGEYPSRLVGLGTLPMQDTRLAIAELDRCVGELGFRGIQIGARVGDEELSTERFEPLWSRCEELDIAVFIHPGSFASPRFGRHHLANVIGNPLDTTTAVHYLIFDGVMARHPAIKIYLSHGGAFAAAYSARMDHAFGVRADCRDFIDELPSTYLKRFYVDALVFDPDQLAYLIKKFGSDHVVLGTDYPADMGECRPVELVYQTDGLSEDDREQICGINALRLLGLEAADFSR
jgi:aminocarboxymuconate-semialdehyde decarboxylase